MTHVPNDGSQARIAVARQSLQDARDRLDDATGALPDRDGDDTMASPALLGLLLHAVVAKRRLTDLEAVPDTRQMTAALRTNVGQSLSKFVIWLAKHPIEGDQPFGGSSVRYQVGRYCDYLHTNPWPGGDPLSDAKARDGAAGAYSVYLDTFNTPAATII